jgi:hypothetical protein
MADEPAASHIRASRPSSHFLPQWTPTDEKEALELIQWVAYDIGRLTSPQAEAVGRILKMAEGPWGLLEALGDRARGEWAAKPKWAVKEGQG